MTDVPRASVILIQRGKHLENQIKTIGLITLGCDKNRVDSEYIITRLASAYQFSGDIEKVDMLIINTCSFIKKSRIEAHEILEEYLNIKCYRPNLKIVVCGCMVESDLEELESYTEIDGFIGINHYKKIKDLIDRIFAGERIIKVKGKSTLYYAKDRRITTPYHYAYLKIADGCDNFCTFCRIPYIRGRYRSQTIETLEKEAKSLVKYGARELILVAQDITKYGIDIYGKKSLVKLLQRLSKIDKLQWIRLLYAYPENIDDKLIKEITSNPKICKYIDIPMQHISDPVLMKMNRKSRSDKIEALVQKLHDNNISIRSTFMLGFPGETDNDFAKLVHFLEDYKLENVGFFTFSKERNTVAENFEETVSEKEKERRLKIVSLLQSNISKNNNKKYKGQVLDVIVDGITDDSTYFVGRTQFQTPDVDGVTYFTADEELSMGDIVKVKITSTLDYDIKGVKV